MREIFHIILALIFMVLTSGLTVNKHYSGGKLYAVSLYGEPDSCCEGLCDCCHNESDVYQITDNFLSPSSIELVDCKQSPADLFTTAAVSNVFFSAAVEWSRNEYRRYIHPPRTTSSLLPLIQTFLL